MPYQLNEVIPFEVVFRHTSNGQPFLPTDAEMTVIAPDGTVDTDEAERIGTTFIYRRDVTANQVGNWTWFPVTSDEDITPTLYASVEVAQVWIQDIITMAAIIGQINVNNIQIAAAFDSQWATLYLRHNDDYTGDAGGSIVITGINNYDLTDSSISKVFLSIKPAEDAGQDAVPVIGPLESTALSAHAATFNFTHDQTALVFSGVGFVFDVLILYTDATRRTAIYGPVVIADSVTPLGST